MKARQTEKKLLVVAQGGLCNRLRVVLSVLSFARHRSDVRCEVVWNAHAECGARFGELFLPIERPNFHIREGGWRDAPVERRNLHMPWLFRRFGYDCQLKNYLPAKHGSLERLLNRWNRVYASTCYCLGEYGAAELADLVPLPSLQRQVASLWRVFSGRPVVGVHIRRTDHKVAMEHSPVEAFREAIERELRQNPEVSFFLSTDDESLKQVLCERYRGHVFVQPIVMNRRDCLAGMKAAVVDLWTLARTQKILGSYWSSFTDTAAELGGIPLEIVKQNGDNK